LALEEIHNKLVNNINPGTVDPTTQNYLKDLRESIVQWLLFDLQREKIQFTYENEMARLFSQAMPNPLYLLAMGQQVGNMRQQTISITQQNTTYPYWYNPSNTFQQINMLSRGNPLVAIGLLAAESGFMAMDSFIRYNTEKKTAETNLVFANLDLQANELKQIFNSQGKYFDYSVDLALQNSSSSLPLVAIKAFVTAISDENKQRTLTWLESNQSLYAKYAPYYLALADTYYDQGQYQKCLDSVQTYESLQAPIFRKDIDFARVLPKAILAAYTIHNNSPTYISMATQYLQKIKDNINESDWELRYFAAQTYISLAAITNRQENLQTAYDFLKDNIIYFSKKQDAAQNSYTNRIENPKKGEYRAKEKRSLIKQLKKERKTELPPMHSGLALNYQTIFPLMDQLNKTQEERIEVSGILRNTTVMPQFRHTYFGDAYNYTAKSFSLAVKKEKINCEFPAVFLSADSNIDVSITGEGQFNSFAEVPYIVQKVIRKKTESSTDFTIKMKLQLTNTVVVEKSKEYTMRIEIKTHKMPCAIVFSSPKGKKDFKFLRIE
jgi:hypothetical protein